MGFHTNDPAILIFAASIFDPFLFPQKLSLTMVPQLFFPPAEGISCGEHLLQDAKPRKPASLPSAGLAACRACGVQPLAAPPIFSLSTPEQAGRDMQGLAQIEARDAGIRAPVVQQGLQERVIGQLVG